MAAQTDFTGRSALVTGGQAISVLRARSFWQRLSLDGSELARRSAQWAVAYAKECGAQITVFSAMTQCTRSHHGEIELKSAEAGLACSAINAAEMICPSDEPHDGIIRAAEQSSCDLIFMAVPGPGGLSARLVGTLAQNVASRSRIAVWIIASGDCAPEDVAFGPDAPERRRPLQLPARPTRAPIKDARQKVPNEYPCHC